MTPAEIKAVLERALARLDNGKAWTQKVFARDSRGVEIAPEDPKAVCWCALGAVYAELPRPFDDFKTVTEPLRRRGSPVWVSDNASDFAPVEAMFRRGIASLA